MLIVLFISKYRYNLDCYAALIKYCQPILILRTIRTSRSRGTRIVKLLGRTQANKQRRWGFLCGGIWIPSGTWELTMPRNKTLIFVRDKFMCGTCGGSAPTCPYMHPHRAYTLFFRNFLRVELIYRPASPAG